MQLSKLIHSLEPGGQTPGAGWRPTTRFLLPQAQIPSGGRGQLGIRQLINRGRGDTGTCRLPGSARPGVKKAIFQESFGGRSKGTRGSGVGVEREGDLGLTQAELPWTRHPCLAVKGSGGRGDDDAQSPSLQGPRRPIIAEAGAYGHLLRSQTGCLDSNPTPRLTSCVALGKVLPLSEPQFPYL